MDLMGFISNYLLGLGFTPKHKGYAYLREAVFLCFTIEKLNRLNSDVYPRIAKKYNTNIGAVEKNISNAIGLAWLKGDMEQFETEFGYTIDQSKGKPTAKQLIYSVAEKIKFKLYHTTMCDIVV